MISEEKTKHIAKLSKLKVENMEKTQKQLTDILTDIDKLLKVDIDCEKMISPTKETDVYSEDKHEESIKHNEMFKNSKNKYDNYIKVPKVIK